MNEREYKEKVLAVLVQILQVLEDRSCEPMQLAAKNRIRAIEFVAKQFEFKLRLS